MSTALVPFSDLEKMAAAIAKSRLFGAKTPDEAMALMLVAQAEGMHPAAAARDYHIIQGRPAMKADAMMARYIASGGRVEWHDYTDEKVSGTFAHPAGGTVRIEWTFAQAKKIGLASKDNWKNYPRQMLRARVISEGVRTTNPAVAVGVYTPEEVEDFSPAKEKDMGAAEVIQGDQVTKAQLKRLEATITSMHYDRNTVRAWCKEKFGKDHFGQLTKDEYRKLDDAIVANTFTATPPPPMEDVPPLESATPQAIASPGMASIGAPAEVAALPETAVEVISPDQVVELERMLQDAGIPIERFKKSAGIAALRMLPAAEYAEAKAAIEERIRAKETHS